MPVRRLNLNYLKVFIGFALGWAIFAVFIAFYFIDYARLKRIRKANLKVLMDIKNLRAQIKELKDKNKKISKDPLIYEKIARENLGVAREDEIVVDIKE